MGIFMWFGEMLGWLLWWLYYVVQNYGIAIILFTIVLKLLMFPFSVKQQKSMASQSKLAAKQKELQKKYGTDKARLQEEISKLYEKEGVNPMGGCLPMLIPFPVLFGVFYAVAYPLQNTLHIAADRVNQAVAMLGQVPGISGAFNQQYAQIEIIRHFGALRDQLTEIFTGDEIARIETFSHGFKFLGLDLLNSPNAAGFASMLWIIPLFCLISSYVGQFITMKMQPGMQQQQGCMKWMMFLLPLMTVYLSYVMPGAVGFYWTIQTIIGFIQTIILHRFYSPDLMNAKMEAQRVALRVTEEAKVQPLPPEVQQKLLKKAEARAEQRVEKKEKTAGKGKQRSKQSSSDYRGAKK